MNILSFYRGKKVFLTGATGFKGTWLCHVLHAAGAQITGYALAAAEPSLFQESAAGRIIKLITGDVRSGAEFVQAVRTAKPEILLHLAAQPLVRRSYHEPVLTYETNVMGTVHVLEAVRQTPSIRSFINITTDKVYENNEWHWGYRENEPLNGFDPYSNSKSCAELVTSSYRAAFFGSDNSPAISTARSGNVIGGGDYAHDRIIPDCIRAVRMGQPIVVRNPASIRPYQHVLECISGYLLLAARQYENPVLAGAWNFGPNEESCVDTGHLAALFCTAWGERAAWIIQADDGPHEARFLKLDCSKAKAELNWKPRWNIQQAVEKTVEFAKSPLPAHDCLEQQINTYFEGTDV
ncbi:MAG: CDP-glucose 4,6-dehydratase [Spirochaetaceae bacterium]|jgi:CDP-glucose 4,6-dehydratase|nr:CDP-glucose 4,6-dehydratase [Spirochaetaceae bacterium]